MNYAAIRKSGKATLACLLIPLFVSCAHTRFYAEPALPASETAVLQATVPVWIASLDGQRVRYGLTEDDKTLRVSPGPHAVLVSYFSMNEEPARVPGWGIPTTRLHLEHSMKPVQLRFVAKPGHTYYITATVDRARRLWHPSIAEFLPLYSPTNRAK